VPRARGRAVNLSVNLLQGYIRDDFSPGGSDYCTKCPGTREVLVNSGNPSVLEVGKLPIN